MSNNGNLSIILENELSNIFDDIMNYQDTQQERQHNNEDNFNEQTITDIHRMQLNILNNFINQYYSQINIFQENTREMLQMLRTTIHQHNVVYSDILRQNNIRQNPQRRPFYSRTSGINASRAWNIPEYIYEIPQISRRRQETSLTQEQMNNAIETIEYEENMIEERCPITLENFAIGESICRIRHCGHIFKSTGLMQWFNRNVRCPVCRYDIRTYEREQSTQVEETMDSSRNLVNTRNIIYNGINNIMRQLQNHLPESEVPMVYTVDVPIYIHDMSYNRTRHYV
jgi:hypothetical protein